MDGIVEKFEAAQDRLVIQASDLSLDAISTMAEEGAIDVAPQFQRRERWSAAKQSALIESFLLNIPVPPVYLAEDDFGRYSVIDGKQRITAIREFIHDRLKLTGLEKFVELESKRFSDLPDELRNALQVRPYLRAVTLLRQSDSEVKFDVFHRLNTGGEPLNPQEIRNVVFRGPLNDLVNSLAEHPFLRRQLKITGERSSGYRRMQDAEFVVRFLTLHEVWRSFKGDLRESMDRFMERHQRADATSLHNYETSFVRAISRCEAFWGRNAFHRVDRGSWRDQALAGMFDAQMIASANISDSDANVIAEHRTQLSAATRRLFADADFEAAVRVGTNTPRSVRLRVSAVERLLASLAGMDT